MPNGEVVIGAGDGPSGNVCGLAREAVAAMFCFAGLPRLYLCGPALVKCAADFNVTEGFKQRVWSFAENGADGWRLFVWSSGAIIGLGRTQEEVESAVQAIQSACRRQGARDLRSHSR